MPAGSSVVITPAPIPFSLSQRIWPPITILVGLLATVAWTVVLGYGLITLVGLAL